MSTVEQKLERVKRIVNDGAGWQLAANQLQSKLVDILNEPHTPVLDPDADGKKYILAVVDKEICILRRTADNFYVKHLECYDVDVARDLTNYLNQRWEDSLKNVPETVPPVS